MSRGRVAGRRWERVKAAVIERDAGLCQLGLPGCTRRAQTGDHRKRIADGGDELDPDNIRAACHHCNRYREAYLAHYGIDPAPPAPPLLSPRWRV